MFFTSVVHVCYRKRGCGRQLAGQAAWRAGAVGARCAWRCWRPPPAARAARYCCSVLVQLGLASHLPYYNLARFKASLRIFRGAETFKAAG